MPPVHCVEHTAQPPSQMTRVVDIPFFLQVSMSNTMLFVHRSVFLKTSDPWYQVVYDLVGDAEPIVPSVIVPDEGMMFGQAEHSLYALKDE